MAGRIVRRTRRAVGRVVFIVAKRGGQAMRRARKFVGRFMTRAAKRAGQVVWRVKKSVGRFAARVAKRGGQSRKRFIKRWDQLRVRLGKKAKQTLSPLSKAVWRSRKRASQFSARMPKHVVAAKRSFMLALTKQLAAIAPAWRAPPNPSEVRQILLFGDMGIGNFIMFTPTLRALRERFPQAEQVVLFMKARGAEHATRNLTSIDRSIMISTPKEVDIRGMLTVLREMRRQQIKPDVVIARWNGSPYVAIIVAALRSKWRIGHVSSAGYRGFCDDVFNAPVLMPLEAHEVHRNLDLAARANAPVSSQPSLEFPVTEEETAAARSVAVAAGLDFNRLICLQCGSSKLQFWKRWPLSHSRELALKLVANGYQVAFIGSKDERAIPEEILAGTALEAEAERLNLCGKMTLHETGAFLKLSRAVVCNDSGLMHVAAAVGTPMVAIFGPTEYDRTRPYAESCVLLREACECNAGTLFDRQTLKVIEACERPCLSLTSPTMVFEKLVGLLEENAQRIECG